MRITILAPSATHPVGGTIALYEFANGLARRGHDVCLAHVDFIGTWDDHVARIGEPIGRVSDITWFRFESRISHRVGVRREADLPPADVTSRLGPPTRNHPRTGLPLLFLQGYGIFPPHFERQLFDAPCPKVCVGSWLVRLGEKLGAASRQFVHIPCGLDHDTFRISFPPEARPLQVAMCYGSHHTHEGRTGLDALERVHEAFPELRAIVFGPLHPRIPLPQWLRFHLLPPRNILVDRVYNGSRVFLNPRVREGFGLPSVEAMACGCALVTVSNGGSEEYAIPGETAVVCPSGGAADLAVAVSTLLADDPERLRLARNGERFVKRLDWDQSARRLDDFLAAYVSDPARLI